MPLRSRRTARLLCGCVLTVALTLALCSGAVPLAREPADADAYLALVDAYRSGRTRESVIDLSNRDDRWVEGALAAALKSAAIWPAGRVEAGILLHTETVTGGWVLPSHNRLHLDAARRLLGLSRRDHRSRLQRDWLLVLCWHFQSELDLGAMVPVLDELRSLRDGDAEADLAAGTFYEALGWTSATPDTLMWNNRSKTLSALPRHSQLEALDSAAAALVRAARQPSIHDEATIRLGRVLVEQGRPQEARAHLVPLVTGAAEKRWRYLAALFTALADTRAGNGDTAAHAYETAHAMYPDCQTPMVGLTTLRRLQGRTAEAAASAARLTLVDERSCDDPWWFYRFGTSPERLPERLNQMRREYLQ